MRVVDGVGNSRQRGVGVRQGSQQGVVEYNGPSVERNKYGETTNGAHGKRIHQRWHWREDD